ncbi:MAG: HDIG domain-containing protein, partial [Chlamydiia bacterium]|nr:HDIG domain-containing protein [Chlamydiia bacterium]
DQGVEFALRKLAQEAVSEQYATVRAGERLIDQGEKVRLRHIAMLQAMKEKISQKRNLLNLMTVAGSLLMTLLFTGMAAIFLKENHRETFYSNRKLSLLATICALSLVLAKVVELLLLKNTSHLIDSVQFPLLAPFAAILMASLMNTRLAAFVTIFLSVILAMTLAVDPIPFLVVNIITAMVAIMTGRTLHRRKDVFIVCGKAWIVSILVVLAFDLYEDRALTLALLSDLVSTFLFMILTAILVVGLIPLFESTFRIMTDITLIEFMDPSNELLRRLTIEAPGTYQHSMVVGHLAESAAGAIGANGLFCRVATQYHDIGKLVNPQYFTENQLGGIDMHQLLTPLESAQVIIAHVSEGVALARKMGLPEQFIDIIKEHHGTTQVYYFYHKQIELMGGEHSHIDDKDFRYSGPKPRSKESTIIMIADTLEAASRCLDYFNE